MLYSCCDCVHYINNQTNTCVTVNRIRAALKETARYIPAVTVCVIIVSVRLLKIQRAIFLL